jgi:Flp pilus assembly protein TadD/DNA-binding transcriptional MerR regulator
VTGYSRQDVLRILRIHPRQLRGWERSGLIAPRETYSFQDLVQLRKLRDLRATRLSAASIRASISAMRSVSGMANPLLEASTVRRGSRLIFRHSGVIMEPIARQFVFDFDGEHSHDPANVSGSILTPTQREAQTTRLFLEAVRCEETGKTGDAVRIYHEILALDPSHAPASINLGTIFYHQREFTEAEHLYRQATLADPEYALAYFDLGNVLDELKKLPEAIEAYTTAIRLVPTYADAHYNLALAYERTGQRRKALRHWTAYLKLDPIGPWATHARNQLRKILDREKLAVVHSNTRATLHRAKRQPPSLRLVR